MIKKTILSLIILMIFSSAAYSQGKNFAVDRKSLSAEFQHNFLRLDSLHEDSTYLQSVSDELQALLETGEYDYICVDQSAAE